MFFKYRRVFLFFFALSIATTLSANDRSAVWARLYRRAVSLEDKLVLMQSATRTPSEDLIPMLLSAIDELNAMREQLTTTTEHMVYTELSMCVVRAIGEVGAVEGVDYVFDLAKNAEDPYLRGEAIVVVGRLGAQQYAGDIAMMLRNLNLNSKTGRDDRSSEVLAYACILSLERLKAPVGFSPLFFASIGWYSPASGVRAKAATVMQEIIDDPSAVLHDLVLLESDPSVKLEALYAEGRSSAPKSGKVSVAEEALRQGLIRVPVNLAESLVLSRLRLRAIEMLGENGASSESSVDYLEEVMTGTFDMNERITAILALGAQQSEYAIGALVRFLKLQNERQLAGVTPDDYRIVRSTIQVLGRVGNERAVEELLAVGISGWPSSIVREASAALKLLEK